MIETEALSELKRADIPKVLEGNTVNVASFGFVFFDQDGALINERPFHFAPEKEQKGRNVEGFSFFVSGRCQREFQSSDPYFWCALPESAPKSCDLGILLPPNPDLPSPEKLKQITAMAVDQNYLNTLERQKSTIVQAHKNFRESVLEALYEKGTKELFFDYTCKRKPPIGKKRINKDNICEKLIRSLSLPCMQLQPSDLKPPPPKILPKIFYPKQSDDPSSNREGDFTHSEQYALFQASKHLDSFLERCIEHMTPLMWKGRTVGSYAVCIYSSNAMCIRCAQSTLIDFTHETEGHESFNRTITQKLTGCIPASSVDLRDGSAATPSLLPMVFLAGYTKAYKSELYDIESDGFEQFMRVTLNPPVRDATLPVRSMTVTLNAAVRDATVGIPGSLGYNTCQPEENPQMIYHVKIPQKTAPSEPFGDTGQTST